jgi:hypothetical protein
MSKWTEWRLRLGPLDFGMGIRAIKLSEAFRDMDLSRPLPRAADPRVVGRIRMVEESVLAWESEGGSVN